MTETYTIHHQLPHKPGVVPLDLPKITATMRVLPIHGGFILPANECADEDGKFLSARIGNRLHALAKMIGIRITTKKIAEGLQIRRES